MTRPTLPNVDARFVSGTPKDATEVVAWLAYTTREGRALPVGAEDIALDREGRVAVHWQGVAGQKERQPHYLRLPFGQRSANPVEWEGDDVVDLTLEFRDGKIRLGLSVEALERVDLKWHRRRLDKLNDYLPVEEVVTPDGNSATMPPRFFSREIADLPVGHKAVLGASQVGVTPDGGLVLNGECKVHRPP